MKGCLSMIGGLVVVVFAIGIIAAIVGSNNHTTSSSGTVMTPSSPAPAVEVATPIAHDDLSLFVSRFGPPDSEYNSADENPRPPIVTRQLIYKAENLRAVYRADVPIGSPPPYDNWKLIGFQNQTTNAVISPDDLVRLMSHRDRKRTQ
jgi:hypothetical protein